MGMFGDRSALAALYSAIESQKRKAAGLFTDPMGRVEQVAGKIKDDPEAFAQQLAGIAGNIKPATSQYMRSYLSREKGRGVPIDKQSISEFSDATAPLSLRPYTGKVSAGEYEPRPNEVLLGMEGNILHFAEESAKKGYRMHRFVFTDNNNPKSVLKVIEHPERVDYWGDKKPQSSRVKYGYTTEDFRGKGAMSDLLRYSDSKFQSVLEPDITNTSSMLKAYERAFVK
jgi:hypothetical protein